MMSNSLDDWDLRQAKYETHLLTLSGTLRTCPTHGNRAHIEKGYEGDLSIMALECGCWLEAQYYDSIDECVDAWNNQPQIDRINARIAELEANVTGLEEHIAFIHAKLTRANDLLVGYDKQVREVGEMNERLTAELAERETWEPMTGSMFVMLDGKLYEISAYSIGIKLFPDDVRLCRRTSSAVNAAESE
jgi:hypothetical protein